jgi:hypothetical protein
LVIWGGKTVACHPDEKVQDDFKDALYHDHSESHWATLETMKAMITQLMTKYFTPKREELGLPPDQHMVLMMDVYSAHRDKELLKWVKATFPFLILLFVPASFTPFLQPLDVAVNAKLKQLISFFCTQWFANEVARKLLEAEDSNAVNITLDLSLSALKAPFCKWVAQALASMADNKKELMRGWEESDLAKAWGDEQETLFQEAHALEEADTLFVGKNTKIAVEVGSADVETCTKESKKAVAKVKDGSADVETCTKESKKASAKAKGEPAPKPKAKAAKAKAAAAKEAVPVLTDKAKAKLAGPEGPFGCAKCRKCATGCKACSLEKYERWLAKVHDAAAEEAAAAPPEAEHFAIADEDQYIPAEKVDAQELVDEEADGPEGGEGGLDKEPQQAGKQVLVVTNLGGLPY